MDLPHVIHRWANIEIFCMPPPLGEGGIKCYPSSSVLLSVPKVFSHIINKFERWHSCPLTHFSFIYIKLPQITHFSSKMRIVGLFQFQSTCTTIIVKPWYYTFVLPSTNSHSLKQHNDSYLYKQISILNNGIGNILCINSWQS